MKDRLRNLRMGYARIANPRERSDNRDYQMIFDKTWIGLLVVILSATITSVFGQEVKGTTVYNDKHVIIGSYVANGYNDFDKIDLGRYSNREMGVEYGFSIQSATKLWMGLEIHFSKDHYNLDQLKSLDTTRSLIFYKEVSIITLAPIIGYDIIRRSNNVFSFYSSLHQSALLKGKNLTNGVYEESSYPPLCYQCKGEKLFNASATSLSVGMSYKYWLNNFIGINMSLEANKVIKPLEKVYEPKYPLQPICRIGLLAIF